MRGGDVESPKIVAAKRGLRDGRAWQAQRRQQLALRRIASQAPSAEHAGPDATFDVDNGPVRKTFAGAEACEDAFIRERAIPRTIERVDDPGQRIRVIESATVRAFRRTVAHDVAGIAALTAGVGELVERAARLFLRVVHRAEPQVARGIDEAVVEPVVRRVRFDDVEESEVAGVGIELVQPGLEAGDHPARGSWKNE